MRQGIPALAAWLALAALRPQEAAPADEGALAERGRLELAALVERLRAAGPEPRAVALDEHERALGLPFRAVELPGLRVLSTGGEEEARSAAEALGAAQRLFAELCAVEATFPPGCRVFLLTGAAEQRAFFERHPALDAETRSRIERLEGAGIPGTADWAHWEGDQEKHLDGVVRLAFDWFLKSARGITLEDQAWLHEGLGFFLTHALVGTRLTWFVPLSARDPRQDVRLAAIQARLKDPEADWLFEARDLFDPAERFDLEELFHLLVGELDGRDYLRAHAVVAYLLEAQRPALAEIVGRLGAREDARAVLTESLGFDLTELRRRLERWLETREVLVARAEGRRTEAELLAAWQALAPERKAGLLPVLRRKLQPLETTQLALMKRLASRAPKVVPAAGEPDFYDPAKHAPAQPIPRRRLPATDERAQELLAQLKPAQDPRALRAAHAYDWGRRAVVRSADPDDPETVFANALRGYPPGLDLARAQALRDLDGAEKERKTHAAFAHAYTDRDGNVYPGLTLYDMWCSGRTIEMPDVDALGVVHEVLNDWKRWVAPVPASEHAALYRTLEELFRPARRSRELREALADALLMGQPPPRPGYESLQQNLQALWAEHDSDPRKLAKALPDGKGWEEYLAQLVQRCRKDPGLFASGKLRAAGLRRDGEAVRRALGQALDELAAEGQPGSDG